ncbi:MAG: argininosuccinate lyase [Gemmatimonadota bacterium]|nr:argininosuccinate lyase [Gemmatimonadota bacterium]
MANAKRTSARSVRKKAAGHQLWGGRFATGPDPALVAINRSIDVDFRLWPHDIQLSKAWAAGLVGAGVLSRREAGTMRRGLDRVARRLGKGVKPLRSDEDIHTLIDRLLHEEVGQVASRLHTGRSRNDQVATASRLYVMQAMRDVDVAARALQRVCLTRARKLTGALMPAYTHLQRAQPVSVAHWLLAHFWAVQRDRERLATAAHRAGVMPLGSGAIAGSAFRINRPRLARELGFHSISQNSIDAVGDRDFMADALFALTGLALHTSRLAEDLILFGSSEFGFVRFGDAFSTGSSMMPQKRNPDALELARASPARVLGDLVSLVATIKGTPSGYNKDFQEDKRPLFDAVNLTLQLLPAVTGTVRTLTFNVAKMRSAISSAMMATDLADYLVRQRVTFREAHGAVGGLVREAEIAGVELDALPESSFLAAHPLFQRSARRELGADASLRNREVPGGTGPKAVAAQIVMAEAALAR